MNFWKIYKRIFISINKICKTSVYGKTVEILLTKKSYKNQSLRARFITEKPDKVSNVINKLVSDNKDNN